MKKTMRILLASILAVLMSYAAISQAEDIDIYSGSMANGTPNLMFVMDNPASQNNAAPACKYWDNTDPSNNNKALGLDQCALANIVHGLPVKSDLSAVINLGITTMAGVYFKLTPIDDNIYTGTDSPAGLVAGVTTNRQAFILAVKAITDVSGKSGQGSELQETWAYYTGGNGGTTGTGILSGTTYAGTNATTGCQKNYIIYLSNVDNANASHPQQWDSTEMSRLTESITNAVNANKLTSAQGTALNTKLANMPAPVGDPGEGREWARFMKTLDINSTAAGTGSQTIITYSVATGDTAVPPAAITHEMENYIKAVSTYGNGKYYPAGNDSTVLTNSILKILNEVQAVNSVFASSSLPVSVNAQGTYLNQIYMGMFRPDPEGNPRWIGNLKQYHFTATRDLTTHLVKLALGDSLDASAINPATGFITPNAVSFWTCGGSPSVRACSPVGDPAGGFWINDALKTTDSTSGAYDLPDGEWVDKGGAAQIVRLANLTDNYATAAGTATNPRKLYTCTGCASGDSLSSYLFSSDPLVNPSLTGASFGIIPQVSISSLTRSGSTASVTTAAAHGVTNGQVVQVSGANEPEYNGSFVMTVVDATHVAYTLNVSPVSPATGTISANVPTGASIAITALTRVGTTVTVTAAGNTFVSGSSVTISGVTPAAYNGSWTISCAGSCDPSFTFTGPAEGPTTPSGNGSAAVSGYTTRTIATSTANPDPGFVRVGTLVTVKTTANHGFPASGTVTISGADDSTYNGNWSFTNTGNRTFTFNLPCTTPCTPATTLGTATGSGATPIIIDTLTRTLGAGTAATATATTASDLTAAPFNLTVGGTSSLSITGADQSQYNGTFTVTLVSASAAGSTFTYPITTASATPATGTMTMGSKVTTPELINWVRGHDNAGDEFGPGGSITIRPSLHGDVLHSRPITVNYGSPSISIIATVDSGGVRTATASAADVAILAAAGASPGVKFANGESCLVTVASATSFTYSDTSCGAAGAQTATSVSNSNVVVFYGGNDGVFRAINGNQTTAIGGVPAGGELWGFIPPEHFSKLKRLYDNSPILDLPSTVAGISPAPLKKDYFVDGSTGLYQKLNADGSTNTAYLYLSMRRGGRFIYALNITDPADPKYLWKIANTSGGDFDELGQTWSAPKVALIKGYNDGFGNAKPVLVFGAGYDTAEDAEPAGSKTMGRGIYIVDAATGALVWRATYGASSTCSAVGVSPSICTVSGMNYSIPADITLLDRDNDGFIDRLYAVDVGGNVWRVDLQREGNMIHNTPDYWKVNKVASLGGSCCPLRKFFYPADVIPTNDFDALIVGSGDREHPLYTNDAADKQNRIFMLKDLTGNNGSSLTTIVKGDLFQKTTANTYTAAASSYNGSVTPNKGYFIDLLDGEKVVNAPLTVAGYTYLGTHQPTASTTCSANLGIARGYKLSPLDGSYTVTEYAGGGLPPSTVAGVVSVTVPGESSPTLVPFIIGGGGDTSCTGSDCASAFGGGNPIINVPASRTRTYWYREID